MSRVLENVMVLDESRISNSAEHSGGVALENGARRARAATMEETLWNRIQDSRRTDGYRDGLAVAQESFLQTSFNEGFAQGFSFHLKLAKLRGQLAAAVGAADSVTGGRSAAPVDAALSAAGGEHALVEVIEKITSMEADVKTGVIKSEKAVSLQERYGHELSELTSLVTQLLRDRRLHIEVARNVGDA